MSYYKLLDHTADLAIHVWGEDLKELFIHSASAMYELIADTSNIKPSVTIKIKTGAHDKEELLKNWLSELLYYFHVKDMLFKEFNIERLNESMVVSTALGETIDLKRHTLRHEIKAVTYHSLKIEKENGLLATDIVFDV